MNKIIIASMRENAGKTSLIVGLAKAVNKKIGYMKPLGDRLLYRKKQLWDYDSALITRIFNIAQDPMDMSLGFDHAKLRYMYDEKRIKAKLLESVAHITKDTEILWVESGRDITAGISVHLDAISLTKSMGGTLIIVFSGNQDTILDDMTFIKNHIDLTGIDFGGIIINQVHDVEDFKNTYLTSINQMELPVLGIIPYIAALTHYSVGYLSERLFAKVIAGVKGLNSIVQHIFVGAMSVDAALRNPALTKENILTITSGDRTDMILAALESNSVGIILTNNILPPPNIISKASERDIPLLLVSTDTYEVAKQIDNLQPLLTKDDTNKIDQLVQLVKEHVNISSLR
jgi:BioD-like phosphotransacetylase family protein